MPTWRANRNPLTPVNWTWHVLLREMGARVIPAVNQSDIAKGTAFLEGAEGWAFTALIRLLKTYAEWGKERSDNGHTVLLTPSGWLACTWQRTRQDVALLAAVELLAEASLGLRPYHPSYYGPDPCRTGLQTLGLWPQTLEDVQRLVAGAPASSPSPQPAPVVVVEAALVVEETDDVIRFKLLELA